MTGVYGCSTLYNVHILGEEVTGCGFNEEENIMHGNDTSYFPEALTAVSLQSLSPFLLRHTSLPKSQRRTVVTDTSLETLQRTHREMNLAVGLISTVCTPPAGGLMVTDFCLS